MQVSGGIVLGARLLNASLSNLFELKITLQVVFFTPGYRSEFCKVRIRKILRIEPLRLGPPRSSHQLVLISFSTNGLFPLNYVSRVTGVLGNGSVEYRLLSLSL